MSTPPSKKIRSLLEYAVTSSDKRAPPLPSRHSILILPNEILELVVKIYLEDRFGRRGHPASSMTITSICRLFRAIATRLILHLSLNDAGDLKAAQLSRTILKTLSLSLTLKPDVLPFWARRPSYVLNDISISVPLATSLEIKRGGRFQDGSWMLPSLFYNLSFPSLTSLTLCNFGLGPTSLREFHHLTHLALVVRPDVNGTFPSPLQMHPTVVLGALEHFAKLERLELDGAICSRCIPYPLPSVDTLRQLRSIRLANHGCKQLDVLKGLVLPPGTKISLYIRSLPDTSHLQQLGDVLIEKLGMDPSKGADSDMESFSMFALQSISSENPTVSLQWHRHPVCLDNFLSDGATPDIEVLVPLPEPRWADSLFTNVTARSCYTSTTQFYIEPLPPLKRLLPTHLFPLLSLMTRLDTLILGGISFSGNEAGGFPCGDLSDALLSRKKSRETLEKLILWNCFDEGTYVHEQLSPLANEFYSSHRVDDISRIRAL